MAQTRETEVDGPFLRSAYSFTRKMLRPGFRRFKLAVEISICVWGLGISTVDIEGKDGFRVRQWVLATPVDGELIDMGLVVDLRQLPRRWWLKGLLEALACKMRRSCWSTN